MRKAQAAMEFLMTYGWAILVVLAAIGALAYFGVLSPDRFLAEKCILSGGVFCLDHTFDTTNGFTVRLQNSAGYDITNVAVELVGTGCTANMGAAANGNNPTALADGAQASYTFPACNTATGKYKGDLVFNFTNSVTGLAHSKSGELVAQAG